MEDIDEGLLGSKLLTSKLPDPELLIRTSGESRISNFLLYQLAYAELIFVKKYWPELTEDDLHAALAEYNDRNCRFGK